MTCHPDTDNDSRVGTQTRELADYKSFRSGKNTVDPEKTVLNNNLSFALTKKLGRLDAEGFLSQLLDVATLSRISRPVFQGLAIYSKASTSCRKKVKLNNGKGMNVGNCLHIQNF
ncbi:hypothetical protein POM88_004589 [Heracleum sosnowskyi]|uniref:Uncharacterized protein n=1 Tax=Heracleum sosnowskyi TaxID=360622 RepID=A0AAD8JK70_9APIA|nr:hypothetical protein POM88_004589 [Heracleum sosnowskyi]